RSVTVTPALSRGPPSLWKEGGCRIKSGMTKVVVPLPRQFATNFPPRRERSATPASHLSFSADPRRERRRQTMKKTILTLAATAVALTGLAGTANAAPFGGNVNQREAQIAMRIDQG